MGTGERIRNARKEKGITQRQLGQACGIDEANIRKYESDRQNPKIETLQKIANALDISVAELLGKEKGSLAHFFETGDKESVWRRQINKAFDELSEHEKFVAASVIQELATIPTDNFTEDDLKIVKQLCLLSLLLNETGQKKAVEQVADLAKIPDYQKPKTSK